jgi:uncharacterized protein YbaP (TraB family)
MMRRWRGVILGCILALNWAAVWAQPVTLVGPAQLFDHGLLFRIEGPGHPVSYVFGTIHSDDPRVTRLPAPVRRAFDQAATLVMEVPLSEANTQRSMAAVLFGDGRQLSEVLDEEVYAEAVAASEELGLPESAVRRCKPWGLVTLLSAPPARSGKFLDLVLYNQAQDQGKPVIGLEEVEEQLQVFEGLSEPDQVSLLRSTLAHRHRLAEMHEELLRTYLRRDLSRLQELNMVYMSEADPGLVERFQEGAIVQRNGQMVERLLPLLEAEPAFVAVGALHLPGPNGILFQLQQRGLQVTRIY